MHLRLLPRRRSPLRPTSRTRSHAVESSSGLSDLLRCVPEVTVALPESTTLGSKTARGHGLLLLSHGLTLSPATPFAAQATGSGRGVGSRLASVGRATHIVHASSVVSDSLAMMLLAMVAVAAQGAHTTGALVIC